MTCSYGLQILDALANDWTSWMLFSAKTQNKVELTIVKF